MNQTDKLSGVENAQGQDVGDGIFILKDSFTHDPTLVCPGGCPRQRRL